jgi:hypothetical protein
MKRSQEDIRRRQLFVKNMIAKWNRELALADTCADCPFKNQECKPDCPVTW